MIINNFIYSTATVLLRSLVVFLIFFLLAQYNSVTQFGRFSFAYLVASILVLLVDYGYSIKLVRDTSTETASISENTFKYAKIKIILFLFLCILLLSAKILSNTPLLHLIIIFTLAAALNSFGTHFLIPFRSINRFYIETIIVVVCDISLLLTTYYLITNNKGFVVIGIGFLINKLFYLFISLIYFSISFGIHSIKFNIIHELYYSLPYALQVGLGAIYLNIDSILIKYYLDDYSLGIYQAGMRILGAYMLLLVLFNNVLLPRFSNLSNNAVLLLREAKIYNYLIIISSCIVLFTLNIFGEAIISLIYGEKYYYLNNYIFLFSIVIILRYLSIIYGNMLTACGEQKIRTRIIFSSLVIIILLNIWLIPTYKLYGALFTLIIAHIFILILYVSKVYKKFKSILL